MGVEQVNLEELEARLIQIRRDLHEEPELSNEEYETTRKIKQWLSEVGIKVLDLPSMKTGVVAVIGTGQAPVIAIRGDIDALPIDEQSGVPFSSKIPGKMHACGHDFHTATIFGAAYLLKQQEAQLQGTVKILFQPAEETGHGAKAVISSGALDDVEAIFGLHNSPDLAVGEWGSRAGALTAGVDRFEIKVKGVGAHAAHPENGNDAIVAASQIVIALQTITSRIVSAQEAVVVSVTRITGGNTWNVLPETVELEGTVRTLNTAIQQSIPDQINQILNGIGTAFGVEATLHWYPGPPATINDATWTQFAREVADEVGYTTKELQPSLGGEDFSYYLQQIPGAFVRIGSQTSYSLHHPKYNPSEAAILPAAQYFCKLSTQALRALQERESLK